MLQQIQFAATILIICPMMWHFFGKTTNKLGAEHHMCGIIIGNQNRQHQVIKKKTKGYGTLSSSPAAKQYHNSIREGAYSLFFQFSSIGM